MRRVLIKAGSVNATAELNESPTADAIWAILPITASASRWGKEIYFSIAASPDDPDTKAVVQKGDLGYWAPGSAFCVFWGPTPASQADEIRPASPVSVFGKVVEDPEVFDSVKSGTRVIVEKLE